MPPRPDRTQIFNEAEQRILEAGREVAEQQESLQLAHASVAAQQQAQQVTWQKLQTRIAQEEQRIEGAKAETDAGQHAVFTAALEIKAARNSVREAAGS